MYSERYDSMPSNDLIFSLCCVYKILIYTLDKSETRSVLIERSLGNASLYKLLFTYVLTSLLTDGYCSTCEDHNVYINRTAVH